VLITRGEKGMSLFEESAPRPLNIPATNFEVTYARVGQPGVDHAATGRQVFDVTGAGDTVIATLAAMLACGLALREAVPIANRAGGIVVGKFGTASVGYDELGGGEAPA
jgi:bifunctional ADP-heptose synthase (sugar kinase/adenylyltransferase)